MSQRATEIKVGIFVLLSLGLGSGMTFIIGSANQTFETKVSLRSSFSSVSGLAVGSQVRLSGLKIGVVDMIWLSRDPKGAQPLTKSPPKGVAVSKRIKFVQVRMKVSQNILKWIREDSVATVEGKGLLGDALINITVGSKGKTIQPGGWVLGITPKGLSDVMADGGQVIAALKRTILSVEDILKQYQDPRLSRDLKGIIHSVDRLLYQTRKGPGFLHDVLYSRELSRRLRGILYQVERTGRSLAGAVAQIEWILRRAKRKGSLVHRLFISKKSGDLADDIKNLSRGARATLAALNKILRAPQKNGTLLHKILFEKESSKLLGNLMKASDDVRTIIRDIRKGKGSLGAVINDPTAFEDFKIILGQIKRNRIFRSLIRFVIKRDDSRRPGAVKPQKR